MKIIALKIISLYTIIKHFKVPVILRYFCRDTYYCQFQQLKYIFKDYFFKRPYKEITFSGEFAPELQFVLPFAYWHYKNGTLLKTQSSVHTKAFYFFSPQHEEVFTCRTNDGNYNYEVPRVLYSHDYKMNKWLVVPLKKYYQNNIYVFEKPTLVIANRYNSEWGGPPISFIPISVLQELIPQLKEKYTIVYNRAKSDYIVNDDSNIFDLEDYEWLNKYHPEVIVINTLYERDQHLVESFNHLQLMVYANASCFISTHGGTATLASYFGGVNIILSKKGPEHYFKCYKKLYPKLSGATIYHVKTNQDLIIKVKEKFLDNA
jgi:hypothetical protein